MDAIRNDKIAELLEARQEHDVRELNKALNEFRALHQQPDNRREFDLYDPDYLKKDKPARVSDDDPRYKYNFSDEIDFTRSFFVAFNKAKTAADWFFLLHVTMWILNSLQQWGSIFCEMV